MSNSTAGILCALLASIVYIKFGMDERLFFIIIVAIIGFVYVDGDKKKG